MRIMKSALIITMASVLSIRMARRRGASVRRVTSA
jgi:hypothetical protein